MFPLQVPGGVELVVIFLVLVVPVAVLAGLAYLLVVLVRRSSADGGDDRGADLEQRVADLEAELERERDPREPGEPGEPGEREPDEETRDAD